MYTCKVIPIKALNYNVNNTNAMLIFKHALSFPQVTVLQTHQTLQTHRHDTTGRH